MGTAPSSEIVRDAPFRAPQGFVRQVALIPIVEQYFPTPDCLLFRQLYEAYTDPSVRYYTRPNFDGKSGDLSRIPPIENSREDMHRLLLRHTAQGMFPTNAAVRQAYEAGDSYRIRPVLSAVVFFYEGTSYAPEGSVRIHSPNRSSASAFVKVIGVIGDACTLVNRPDDPLIPFRRDDVLHIRTLIMKSAGDHNMSHVVLLAAYIYYYQCCRIIGLPMVPTMAATFRCFKTNIPFLCFLREMRDRTACVLGAPEGSHFYIDEYCLHGTLSQPYTAKMVPAFACYYISFLSAKLEKRALKQQTHQPHPLGGGGAERDRAGSTASGLMSRAETHVGSIYAEAADDPVIMAMKPAAMEGVSSDVGNTAPKITYVVKGYITRAATSLSNWSHAANEVYVVCVNGTVTVVDRVSVEARDGPTRTPSLTHEEDPSEGIGSEVDSTSSAVVEVIQVSRGDILSFYVPPKENHSTGANPTLGFTAIHNCSEDDDIIYSASNIDALRICSTSSASSSFLSSMVDAPSHAFPTNIAVDAVKGGSDAADTPTADTPSKAIDVGSAATFFEATKGSWHVDRTVCIENVLLSLVRDECKLAREATEQDRGWVRDDVNNCLVHDGSFYLWRFRRGHEDFYYGTVPKFANPSRQRSRSNGAGGSGVDVGQGKVNRGGFGAARDLGNGLRHTSAGGGNGTTSPFSSTPPSIIDGKVAPNTQPSSVYLHQRPNPPSSQPLQPQHQAPRAPFLTPTFVAGGSDLQQAHFAASASASAALPPPPAYSRGSSTAGHSVFMPTTSSVDQDHLTNPMYVMYSADKVAMTSVGAPMMYTFMSSKQENDPISPAQQQQQQQQHQQWQQQQLLSHLHSFPSHGFYNHPVSSSPPQPQPVWGSLGVGNGHATSAPGPLVGPYIVNSPGQPIPLGSVVGGGAPPLPPPPVPAGSPPISYTQTIENWAPQPHLQYVTMNGQVYILQSAAPTAIASAQPQSYPHYPQGMVPFHQ
ncbi:hypothetical protein JKF63_03880 [Porcisia hertigi]|uniref:Uncharacterized protein n=1 Tax=Porcisia hertigi TaxID=2761500 RepID=A0A836L7F6_9TRYP|nr:hypothetical protein JKF63_03880 [Porcisia hertigi]